MAELPGNLVIRRHAPVRGVLLTVCATALGVFALYVAYELGRYDAGYDRLAVSQQRAEYEVSIEKLDKANRELRTRLAELDTMRVGRSQERAELARTIGELQAQVARQSQELAFYRGVVTQTETPSGLKIQQLRITAGDKPDHFQVHMTLEQSVRPDDLASGTVALRVEGAAQGAAMSLDHAALTGGAQHEQSFSFRYFQNLDEDIELPSGFKAERLMVEVHSARKGVTPLTQTFVWQVDAARDAAAEPAPSHADAATD
jgi:hypothetical protein